LKRIPVLLALSAAPLLALCVSALADDAGIHECKDANGETVYQDEPCVEPVPAPAKPKVASKSKTASKPAKGTKATTKTTTTQTTTAKTTTVKATAPPRLQMIPKPLVVAPPPKPRRFEPAATGRSGDARWATPEKTLQTFVDAVAAGDRDLVLSCLTSEALADLGPDPPDVPLDRLQATVGSFTGFVAEGDLGPFWSIRAQRGAQRPKWIFFQRTGSGEWKIGVF
jgi:hypothetical protein